MFALLTPMLACGAVPAPAATAPTAQPKAAPRQGTDSPVRTQPPAAAVLEYLGRYADAADGIDPLGFAQDEDEDLQSVPKPERH
jgi:hypothetical protein